jgi:hypothetical protein
VYRNDLSNRPVPKAILVFEGALGFMHQADEPAFQAYMSKGWHDQAVALFTLNDLLMKVIWQRVTKDSLSIELVTFLGDDNFARALADRIWTEELPIRSVWSTRPDRLARKLISMPDIVRVYDPWPDHQAMYGAQVGRYLTDANQFGRA